MPFSIFVSIKLNLLFTALEESGNRKREGEGRGKLVNIQDSSTTLSPLESYSNWEGS